MADNEESIVAEQRYYYHNRNSQYIGSGIISNKSKYISEEEQKPIREGRGVYKNQDGQLYIGDWKKG